MLTSEADAGVHQKGGGGGWEGGGRLGGGGGGSVKLIAIAGMFSGLWLMSLHQEGCSSKLLFGGHLVIKVLLVPCSGVLPGDFREWETVEEKPWF